MTIEDELYREIILDNYKSKKNRGSLENATLKSEGANPSCGDELELFVELDGTTIKRATYEGAGCSICCASANMLCDAVSGRGLDEVRDVLRRFKAMLLEGGDADFPDELSDLEAMEGVKQYPVRIKCALLSWSTLELMLREIEKTPPPGAQ